jgi:hypothetical protein
MKRTDPIKHVAFFLGVSAALAASAPSAFAQAPAPNHNFIVRATAKTPDTVVADIKRYVLDHKWLYLAEFKVKNDEVTVVKMCVPSAGPDIWKAGLHVSALLPCGHIGVYAEGGATRLSMLDPRFMNQINPHPNLKKAGDDLYPILTRLLDDVTRSGATSD